MVQTYFRNHHKPQAWLSEKGGKKHVLAGDTRWNSHIDMVESFLANRCYDQEIIQEHENDLSFDSLVVAKVMDYSLCMNGKTLLTNFDPLHLLWTGVRVMDHHWQPGLEQLQDKDNRLRLLENTMIMITFSLNVIDYDYIVK